MNPIISPWIIYWMGVIHSLDMLCNAVLGIYVIAGAFFAVYCIVEPYSLDGVVEHKKIFTFLIIGLCVDIIGIIFIPSKKDMMTMLVLSYVTPDNIQLVQNDIVDFIQKIMMAVEKGAR